MQVIETSIPAVLRERASLQPNDTAFTFIDYEQDWDGVAESLTWSQLYRRTLNVAHELRRCGSTGDRAVILAPQGLDYIVAFLGAMQAGQIAVPLSVPMGGVTMSALIRCCTMRRRRHSHDVLCRGRSSPSTSSRSPARSAPSVVEVDLLDLDARDRIRRRGENHPSTAYLQYTSGSTRQPAGVMVSNREHSGQFRADLMSDYFADYGKRSPAGHHCCVVAAVLSRHGSVSGNLRADSGGTSRCAHEPGVVSAAAGPVDAIAGKQPSRVFGSTELRVRIGGAKNIRR